MSEELRKTENNEMVRVAGLTKQVTTGDSELTILRDVSFSIASGEAVAVVGASGSGKSTLLGLLAGLDTPTAGSVQIDGEDLFALDEDGRAALRARLLGFVFQSFNLLPAMTALENVMLPLELAGAADAAAEARGLLERVGLGQRLTHYPKQLSGGEQQRVAIARAVANAPLILLADEPTGNLDPETAGYVFEALEALVRQSGLAALIATHNHELAGLMDRRVTLSEGLVVDF
jgi:putative ABC transport system ATP-binding protein